ncbi:Enoyl-CoA hydratase/isomerase [Denitrovibrio acetiphilus DSM 12809]|uniref:Enoyl-CoA hydratase/isomerase n=1 Tax=Denitrovibrio acetiphilus (strain DSM 12809 / NBRC 114555 / N2460) TaxID=522772 RepID=D4H6L0_DENA2|nr:enoyl-CoA hydratase/isomerase family protein [Denitrovibrio acetiphilus]ADD69684.1 Enoyl-CoA hydratase/isomerase [Denitrovibrio acetiphilus DSM 12809]
MIDIKVEGLTAYIDMRPAEGQFTLLDVHTLKELISAVRKVQDSPAKVIRICGHNRCFAVGADIKTMHSYSGFDAKWFSRLGNTFFGLLRTASQVVIAEIDGFCMGGGMDFASACDFRIATKVSKFAHPGAKLGIITGFGGTQSVPRMIKSSAAGEFFLTGGVFDAEYMHRAGFVTYIAENRDDMHKIAENLCVKINRKQRGLISNFKSSLDVSKGLI